MQCMFNYFDVQDLACCMFFTHLNFTNSMLNQLQFVRNAPSYFQLNTNIISSMQYNKNKKQGAMQYLAIKDKMKGLHPKERDNKHSASIINAYQHTIKIPLNFFLPFMCQWSTILSDSQEVTNVN